MPINLIINFLRYPKVHVTTTKGLGFNFSGFSQGLAGLLAHGGFENLRPEISFHIPPGETFANGGS